MYHDVFEFMARSNLNYLLGQGVPQSWLLLRFFNFVILWAQRIVTLLTFYFLVGIEWLAKDFLEMLIELGWGEMDLELGAASFAMGKGWRYDHPGLGQHFLNRTMDLSDCD
jgi:hypothetical protein